jgi:hypothetical protein
MMRGIGIRQSGDCPQPGSLPPLAIAFGCSHVCETAIGDPFCRDIASGSLPA